MTDSAGGAFAGPSSFDPGSPAPSSIAHPVDPQLAEAVESAAREANDGTTPVTVAEIRAMFRRMRGSITGAAPDMRDVIDLEVPGGPGKVRARLYVPHGESELIVVYLHGGGWVLGDLDTGDGIARHLAASAGARVLSVEYRKAPEHPFPAALDDALASVEFAAIRLAGDRPLAVAGDSAGATLATVCAIKQSWLSGGPIRAQLLAYPATDCDLARPSYSVEPHGPPFRDLVAWCWDQYVPSHTDRLRPEVSPLHTADLSLAPPVVLVLAGLDGVLDEGLAYAARLSVAGVEVHVHRYDAALHDFLAYAGLVDISTIAITAAARDLRAATLRVRP